MINRLAYPLVLTALLAGCAQGTGRYSIDRDRAPAGGVDPASVPIVVPEPVVRTAAGNRSPYTVFGRTYHVLPTERGYSARGLASWYGEKFHGHKTANGEVYNMYHASAAHTALPIPSFLRVTNLENNRSLVVRVNDRGPFFPGRIIDLSYAAAVKLGFADRGTTRVRLEAIVPGENDGPALPREASVLSVANSSKQELYLQIGAFSNPVAAEEIARKARAHTASPVFVTSGSASGGALLHRVRIGPVGGIGEARELSRRLVAAGLGTPYTVAD